MIKYFDIFAGIGGFRSGLEKAGGFKCVGYCEIDKYAKKAYETLYDTEGEVFYDPDKLEFDELKLTYHNVLFFVFVSYFKSNILVHINCIVCFLNGK